MVKYRLLTIEELEALEKEFINYLVINGITADEWVKIKEQSPEKATTTIELFSDVVFEGIMRKTQFLQRRTKQELQTFHCLADKIILMGMKSADKSADFTQEDYIREAVSNPPKNIEVYTVEKSYNKARELEVFEMTMQGCQITDGSVFKTIALIMAS